MSAEEYKEKLRSLMRKNITAPKALSHLCELLDRMGEENGTRMENYTENIPQESNPEDVFQRAIISSEKSTLTDVGVVTWLDIELPVVFGSSSSRSSLDILGRVDDGKIVLCELKYANPNATSESNRPVYALFELLIYYFHILRNADALESGKVRHKNRKGDWNWTQCKNPDEVVLAVAANQTYWSRWRAKGSWNVECAKLDSIKNELNLPVKYLSLPDHLSTNGQKQIVWAQANKLK